METGWNQNNWNYTQQKNNGNLDKIALGFSIASFICICIGSIVGIVLSIIVLKDNINYPKKTMAQIALGLSIASIFTSSLIFALSGKSTTFEIPDVTGMQYYDAKETIQNESIFALNIEKVEEYSDSVEEGMVIRTEPSIGTEINSDSDYNSNSGKTIKIYVSKGKGVIMPEIVGLPEEQAKNALSDAGLEAYVMYEYSDTIEKGLVIDAEYESGHEFSHGTSVSITVSKGSVEEELQEIRNQAASISYEDIFRYPSKYESTPIKMEVTITKIEDEKFLGVSYDKAIWADYNGYLIILHDDRQTPEPTLREGDVVTIYGYTNGTSTIETKEKAYQGSLVFGFSYDKTVDSYEVPNISIKIADL